MAKTTAMLLFCLLCLVTPAPAWGEPGPSGPPAAGTGGIQDSDLQEVETRAGYMERLAAGLVVALPNFLIRVLHLQEPAALIFQEMPASVREELRPMNWVAPEEMYFYTFTPDEFGAVAAVYDALERYLPVSLTLMLVFVGVLLYVRSFGGEERDCLKSWLLGTIAAVVAARFGPYLMGLAFDLNRALVLMFRSAFAGRSAVTFFDLLWRDDTRSLGMAIVIFTVAVSVGILNWQYVMRKLTLSVLIMVFPLVAVVSVAPSRRGVLEIWSREFLANVFLQGAHAAVYAFFVILVSATPGQFGAFWTSMAFLLGINGLADLIRRVIGAEAPGGFMGTAGGVMGLGAFIALGRMGLMGVRGSKPAFTGAGGAGPGRGITAPGPGGSSAEWSAPAPGVLTWKGAALRATAAAGRIAAGTGVVAAAGLGALTGGMIGGALAGRLDAGGALGGIVGLQAGQAGLRGYGRVGDELAAVANEHETGGTGVRLTVARRAGLYDISQIFDAKSAARIGRYFGGTAGALAGAGIAYTARTVSWTTGLGAGLAERAGAMEKYRRANQVALNTARKGIQDLTPALTAAKENLNVVKVERGRDSEEYAAALAHLDRLSAGMSRYRLQEIHAAEALNSRQVREQYARLRENRSGLLSGSTADEWNWRHR